MLRHLLRTSHRVIRREINSFSAVRMRQISGVHSLHNFGVGPSLQRAYCTTGIVQDQSQNEVNQLVFDELCCETLESLCEYFEEIVEQPEFKGGDVTFSDGVLTVDFGAAYGTYVINRQSPNKQIWLSSPISGPKRYDLVMKNGGCWVYKHDGVTLHQLLQDEISQISKTKVDFSTCLHSSL